MSPLEDHHGRWVLLGPRGEVADSDPDEARLRTRHPDEPDHAFVPYGPPEGGYRVSA